MNSGSIFIDTVQVRSFAQHMRDKSQELNSLRQTAISTMQQLESAFRGRRASHVQDEWEQMKAQLQNAVHALEQTAAMLTQAANEFDDVNNRG